MWNLKYGTGDPIYKTETGQKQVWRADFWLPMGRVLGEGKSGRLGLADISYYI